MIPLLKSGVIIRRALILGPKLNLGTFHDETYKTYVQVHIATCIFISLLTAYLEVGGYWALKTMYMKAIPSTYDPLSNSTCGIPREDSFHPHPLHSDLPWPGVIVRSGEEKANSQIINT